jgi:RNA polymerase sigma factor (sigma-70 family)
MRRKALNPENLESVFRKYSAYVYRICLRYARRPEDAEDLTQEVFLKIHHQLSAFRNDSLLTTWIYRIAVNQCLDFLRTRKSQNRLNLDYLDDMVLKNLAPGGDQVQARIDLEKILSHADERTRFILFLTLAEGMNYSDVGELLGVKKSAIAKVVSRFRENLPSRFLALQTNPKESQHGSIS